MVRGQEASDGGRDPWWGPEMRQREGPVAQMGAVEDGRRERGPEGMGWGLGRVGRARDV